MTWRYELDDVFDGMGSRGQISHDGERVSFGAFMGALGNDAGARSCLLDCLDAVRWEAYFWETPPVTAETAGSPFEFVIIPAPALGRMPADPGPFRSRFARDGSVATFPNLGGDAILVVPSPGVGAPAYAHLGVFVRLASQPERHALFQAVGVAMLGRISEAPVWLSTAGLGVAWLHVRLDDRPKYYRHLPYAWR